MIKLIFMELKKLFKKNSTKILFIVILLGCILTAYFNFKEFDLSAQIINTNVDVFSKEEYSKNYTKYLKITEEYNKKVDEEVRVRNYYIDSDIKVHSKEKAVLESASIVIAFLPIVISLISSSTLRDEINKKSAKELLTKPHKRWKILTSKVICNFIVTFLMTLVVIVSFIIVTSLLLRINPLDITQVIIKNNQLIKSGYLITYFKQCFLFSVPLYFISIVSMFLSLLMPNSKMVASIMITVSLMSVVIFQLLLKMNMGFIEYTFFPYLDLSVYKDFYNIYLINVEYGINLNVTKGVIIIIIQGIVFYFLSVAIFNKKDIIN